MPRLYREAPLYSIWEGSGNVICLDVLRALAKDPATVEALLAELKSVAGADKRVDSYMADVQRLLSEKAGNQSQYGYGATDYAARELAERLALALQATLVVRHSSPATADAFIASRLAGQHGQTFGTLPAGVAVDAVLQGVAESLSIDK
jgi:putative acyl-CoA dehydrogenase